VKTSFYVDLFLKSVYSVEEARKLVRDLIEILKLGGFLLKNWLSEKPPVLTCPHRSFPHPSQFGLE